MTAGSRISATLLAYASVGFQFPDGLKVQYFFGTVFIFWEPNKLMDPILEEKLTQKLRSLYGKKSLEAIREELRLSKPLFFYLMGKASLPVKQRRIQYVTKVFWRGTREGGSAPILRVSRAIIRQLDLREGDQVQWSVENGKIVGTPLKK